MGRPPGDLDDYLDWQERLESYKASPVEIELPNGGIVRLPLGVGQVVLVEVIRAVGTLRPWKAPKS